MIFTPDNSNSKNNLDKSVALIYRSFDFLSYRGLLIGLVFACIFQFLFICNAVGKTDTVVNMLGKGDSPRRWNVIGASEGYLTADFGLSEHGLEVISVKSKKVSPDSFYAQVSRPVRAVARKGDYLRFHFWGRSESSFPVTVFYMQASSPYQGIFATQQVFGPEWKEYAITFRLDRDIDENFAGAGFAIPKRKGSFQLADVRLENWGKVDIRPPDINRDTNPFCGQILSPDWWGEAQSRIESIRKGSLRITVVDKKERPLQSVSVKLSQISHKFKFGTAVAPAFVLGANADSERYRKELLRLFNAVVIENDLKWAAVEYCVPGDAEKTLQWCKSSNLPVRGHNLLSPHRLALPASLRDLDKSELLRKIEEHVRDFARKFKGQVYVWDVVNEAVSNPDLVEITGRQIIPMAFHWAREEDPDVLLAYNDNDILNTGADVRASHRESVKSLVRELLADDVPVQILGVQSHMQLPLTRGPEIWRLLDSMSELGLPVEITEYSLGTFDDRLQSEYLEEFLTAIFSHEACQSFYMWGFWDGAHFLGEQGGGIFKKDWSKRPAVDVLNFLIKEKWWTRSKAKTDENGKVQLSAFLGKHLLEVKWKGRSKIIEIDLNSNQKDNHYRVIMDSK